MCGVSAGELMKPIVARCNAGIPGLQAELFPVKNNFFGETVTCSGLLTGQDIVNAVLDYQKQFGKVDAIVLPKDVLKEFDDVFLCGMTLKEMRKKLQAPILVNREGSGYGFVSILAERV